MLLKVTSRWVLPVGTWNQTQAKDWRYDIGRCKEMRLKKRGGGGAGWMISAMEIKSREKRENP